MRRRIAALALALGLAAAAAPAARADIEVADLPKALDSFKVGLEVHSFYRVDSNPYFGAERTSLADGEPRDDANWGEVVGKMRMTAGKKFSWAESSAQVGVFAGLTAGQDAYGVWKDNTNDFELDQGWISFAKLWGAPIEVKLGRQDIQIEKWFLIGQGANQSAAAWLPLHTSFPMAAVVNADFSPFKATAFWARPDIVPDGTFQDQNDVGADLDLYGLNLHFDLMKDTYVYGGVFSTNDKSSNDIYSMVTWDLGGQLKLFDALTLEGEVALETGDHAGGDRDGLGWWGSAGYTLPFSLSPYLRGTYVFYSGDEDPTDGDYEGFDSMYAGFIGWNRWVQGEQTGELWLLKTNKKVWIAEAGFSPVPTMTVSFHYLNTTIDETDSFGTDSDEWGDEVNLFMDWQATDQFFMHLGAGVVMPGDAAEEVTGEDKNAYFAQVWLKYAI